jgi:hypothetical protein
MSETPSRPIRVLAVPREGDVDLRSEADVRACEAITDAWRRCPSEYRWDLLGGCRRHYMIPHYPRMESWKIGPVPNSVTTPLETSCVEFRAERFGFYNMHFIAVIGRYGDADLAVQHERTR